MRQIEKIHAWKQTRQGLVITGLAEGLFFYLFASKSIDSGSFWHYLLALIFLIGTANNFGKAILYKGHGKK